MTASILWRDEPATVKCPVCADSESMRVVADATGGRREPVTVARCGRCGSLHLTGHHLHGESDPATLDDYLEGGAGIASIAETIHRADTGQVRRFLDVGCNYGFAMDLGRFFYGWDVLGVEPSEAGRRGAADLDLPILDTYLDESTDLGEPFDVVLASEVIEHVTDPEAFLRTVRNNLAPGGVAVLTTPAAEVLEPGANADLTILALSPGNHIYLLSQHSLRVLLRRAGFQCLRVTRSGGTLVAVASMSQAAFDRAGSGPPIDQLDLERYFDYRAGSSPAATALTQGMAARHLRSLIGRGDFSDLPRSRARLRDLLQTRAGLDIDSPTEVERTVRTAGRAPVSLAGVAHNLGIAELLLPEGQRQRALDYFDLALTAVECRERMDILDGDHLDLRLQSSAHRALVLAEIAPGEAVAEVARLRSPTGSDADTDHRIDTWWARVFVTLIACGHYDAAGALAPRIGEIADHLTGLASMESRTAGLDALYSLGMRALNTGEVDEARRWLELCADRAERRPASDEHAANLATVSREHAKRAAELGGATPDPVSEPASDPLLHYGLDAYWCDPYGLYLSGWAHAESDAVERITLYVGDSSAGQSPSPRPDLPRLWPQYAAQVSRAGFALYVGGRPTGTVVLELTTATGKRRATIALPDHPLPRVDLAPTDMESAATMLRLRNEAPEGPVVTVGMRSPDESAPEQLAQTFAPRLVVNVDIHPGPGVHVVGDAHQLSRYFRPGSFAIAMTASVLEHVVAPWLVAAEMNRVLMPGGWVFHGAPFAWPEHSLPNDFWRFTSQGLRQLFGPRTGFEVIEAGEVGESMIIPAPNWRELGFLTMPTIPAWGTAWVLARKVRELEPGEIVWPYGGLTDEQAARDYPVEGLAKWGQT